MSTWPARAIAATAETDDLHIAPHRANGVPGTPTWIWSVVVDGALYVRAAGAEHQVTFTPVDPADTALQDRIDAAYRDKYDPSPYVPPMVGERAGAATVRVEPRD